MIRKSVLVAASTLLPLAAVSAQSLAAVPLIPREALFGNPVKAAGQISPDGKYLSWIAPRDGVMNIWVAPAADVTKARPLTNERTRPIRQYFWAPDSRQLLFVNDKGGDENFLLYGVDVVTAAERSLTPFEKTRVRCSVCRRSFRAASWSASITVTPSGMTSTASISPAAS